MNGSGENSVDTVLGKIVKILFAFDVDDDVVTLAQLTRRTHLSKTTTHRLLDQLAQLRLVERDRNGFRLGSSLFELGMRASLERSVLEVATPYMQDLYERTHETVHLAVREGIEVVYVGKIGGHRQAPVPSRVGGRLPLHCTAIGKMLLAYAPQQVMEERVAAGLPRSTPRTVTAPGLLRRQLRRVIDEGIAYEYEEAALGVNCIAAAILAPSDRAIAAISVSGPTSRFQPDKHANPVRAAAAGIAATLARRSVLRRTTGR